MHTKDETIAATASLKLLSAEEMELLATYNAADSRGRHCILEDAKHTAEAYPAAKVGKLSLVATSSGSGQTPFTSSSS